MIDRIIAFSVQRRGLVIGVAVIGALASVYALRHTPIDAIPDLSENQVIVFADWFGHGPGEIEEQITYPLSQTLKGLDGVRVVRGVSDFNFAMLSVICEDRIDVRQARQQIGQQLAAAGRLLPTDVTAYLAPESPATGQIFWYTLEGTGYDLGQLRSVQDWYVRGQLNSLPGVAEVATVGGAPVEFQIEIDPLRLQSTGVTLGGILLEVSRTNAGVGGYVVQKADADYNVRSVGALDRDPTAPGNYDPQSALRDLENIMLPVAGRPSVRLAEIATVSLAPGPRRGVLERDGNEVTGGVISMRFGENPLEVTRAIQNRIDELQISLPTGMRIVPVYDRTKLIQGAVATVTMTLVEAIVGASLCVLVVLLHVRTTLVIALTLPLATLCAFLGIWVLRRLGLADIQTNMMSLAGIAVSIGVLVDVAIVMAENAMHTLRQRFGDAPVEGDTRKYVLASCRLVGRPIFFSVMIMLLSFLPVFALEGAEGKMFRPLAATKSLALAGAALLAITLVPALCTIFVRGRLRDERASPLVRSVMDVYRPVLEYCLRRPAALVWLLGLTGVVAAVPLASEGLFRAVLLVAIIAVALVARTTAGKLACVASLVVLALVADTRMNRLERGVMTPLDELMVMDMPISVPRTNVGRATDDLKARDMVLCRFPEVEMVVGKAGRAETPTDPAPMSMIETMIGFRPPEFWPKRKLPASLVRPQSVAMLDALVAHRLLVAPADAVGRERAIDTAAKTALERSDVNLREYAYHANQQFSRDLAPQLVRATVTQTAQMLVAAGTLASPLDANQREKIAGRAPPDLTLRFRGEPSRGDVKLMAQVVAQWLAEHGTVEPNANLFASSAGMLDRLACVAADFWGSAQPTFDELLLAGVRRESTRLWRAHMRQLNAELLDRAAPLYTRLLLEEHLRQGQVVSADLGQALAAIDRWRWNPPQSSPAVLADGKQQPAPAHHTARIAVPPPRHRWQPQLDAVVAELLPTFRAHLMLWRVERNELVGFGGELDQALQMPGWTNVWTMPIQNRVDMLATGVNTPIGVRVLGRELDDVVQASEQVADVLRKLPGAADVAADPIRGKGYLDVRVDRQRAEQRGVSVGDAHQMVEAAVGGTVATTLIAGSQRYPVRLRFNRTWRDDVEALRRLPVPAHSSAGTMAESSALPPQAVTIPLDGVADVRIVEGPAAIKSENGLLRNYVRMNVRGVSPADFVASAQRVVAERVKLPAGVSVEWTGQYQYEQRARRTLAWMSPLVIGLIFLVLFWTFRDLADAALMLLAVPGALAGGVLFQWCCGYPFSVIVWIGYIACFGMAASTGIIMLVFLRDSLRRAGGLERVDLNGLHQAVLDGAVQRLRPKLLTEGTTIIGLAPMLWASGVGAEVIRPMAAPVLGGILVADEVIDLLLPVLFYWIRRWRWHRLHPQATSSAPIGADASRPLVFSEVEFQ